MARFNFDSDYDDEEFDKEEEHAEEMADELFIKDQIIAVQQENNELLMMEVEAKILENAIAVCKCDWFWNFRSSISKIKRIRKVYKQFKNMIDEK
jgi:hypothetical protein